MIRMELIQFLIVNHEIFIELVISDLKLLATDNKTYFVRP